MQPLNVTEAFGPGWWDVGTGLRDLETDRATRLCGHEYDLAVLGVSSGLDYVVTWGSKAYREGKKRKLYKHGRGAFRRPD